MAATPKNKITRAERGKRRRGNRPMLKKDMHSSVPLHKRGFFSELLKFVGVSSTPVSNLQNTKSSPKLSRSRRKAAASEGQVAGARPEAARVAKPTPQKMGKTGRVTQHKG